MLKIFSISYKIIINFTLNKWALIKYKCRIKGIGTLINKFNNINNLLYQKNTIINEEYIYYFFTKLISSILYNILTLCSNKYALRVQLFCE